jgi:hypothetical protein
VRRLRGHPWRPQPLLEPVGAGPDLEGFVDVQPEETLQRTDLSRRHLRGITRPRRHSRVCLRPARTPRIELQVEYLVLDRF